MDNGFNWPTNVPAPVARKVEKQLTLHNESRNDEYYWLSERSNPETLNYLNAENRYFNSMMAGLKEFRETVFDEMKGRIKEDDETVPYFSNGYWYYSKFERGLQYPVHFRKLKTLDAVEELTIDENRMAEGHQYFSVGAQTVSDDNNILAYTVDTVSRRLFALKFRNLHTGRDYEDAIPNADGNSIAWAADNKTCFYIRKDSVTLLGYQVWRHKLGTSALHDVLVFEEKDDRYSLRLQRMRSKKYIAIVSDLNQLSTEYRLINAANPELQPKVFSPRRDGLQYFIDHANDQFYIRTDYRAPDFRIMVTGENKTSIDNWKEVIAERKNVVLTSMIAVSGHLAIGATSQGVDKVLVLDLALGTETLVVFSDEDVYSANIDINAESWSKFIRVSYTSAVMPESIYDYDLSARTLIPRKVMEVPGYDPSKYRSYRLWVTADDGARIPVTILHKADLKPQPSSPLLLTGYGAYGESWTPEFDHTIFSLVDRGFIYAIAHVRGGQEMGRQWYENGRLKKKKNTFFDFIDCAEFLIAQNFTSPDHLYASGASAGGLLIGAVFNLRPDLFNGVIAEVPFVDVITTMSDPNIPLTTGEYEEWGDPAVKDEYEYMKSYSPYDNVRDTVYPHLLVTTGLYDSQVQFFEPAKWVARMRAMKKYDNLLLFHINMVAGHGGASGRFNYLKDEALKFVFLLALEGKVDRPNLPR
jgi:oligopeptidase B